MSFCNWLCEITGDNKLVDQENRFRYGELIEVIEGFYKGQKGTVIKLHPCTTRSHGWVGYWIKLEDNYEPEEAIPVEYLKGISK